MAQTARFVREAGGQAEFVLRVRQAANPAFAFLAPGVSCHAFYRWLLDAAPQARGRPGRARWQAGGRGRARSGTGLRSWGEARCVRSCVRRLNAVAVCSRHGGLSIGGPRDSCTDMAVRHLTAYVIEGA